ncbi:galactose-specific lectin nattectin-like [Dunckerocampus dactyliophorus]|uniref:galactose-specific lectin nattectin-like n=1 Tax=Dunckerocampus dactyliophorus TaxID=161453 RepID=UPI0024056C27|nr:galactose-specific lectin nattectin-like [Dunckerocampus dactyliophorus]
MQSMVDIRAKKPPKSFILPVAIIFILIFIIGLIFIFIFMSSAPPNLQNLPEPKNNQDGAGRVNMEAHLLNAGICPQTWREHGNRCFRFVKDRKKWTDAEAYCVARGGHLASVHNQTMYNFLKELANGCLIWVGGYKENDEWKWTDGSKFEVKKYEEKSEKDAGWANSQPNNCSGRQDCVEMWSCYGLNDESCHLKQPFICQH